MNNSLSTSGSSLGVTSGEALERRIDYTVDRVTIDLYIGGGGTDAPAAVRGVLAWEGLVSPPSIDLTAGPALRIDRIYDRSGRDVSWRRRRPKWLDTAVDADPLSYPRRVYEEYSAGEPDVQVAVDAHGAGSSAAIGIEWTVTGGAVVAAGGCWMSRGHWFPCLPHLVPCAWTLNIHAPPADSALSLVTSLGVGGMSVDSGDDAGVQAQHVHFFLGHVQSIPVSMHTFVWFPVRYAPGRVRAVVDFLEQAGGFAAWYLDRPVQRHHFVFTPTVSDATAATSPGMSLLPSELLAEEREADVFEEARRRLAVALCLQHTGRMRSHEPLLVRSLAQWLSLQLLRVFHGDNDVRWQLWQMAASVRRAQDRHPDWSVYPPPPFAQALGTSFESYAVDRLAVVWQALQDRLGKTPTTLRTLVQGLVAEEHEPFSARSLLRAVRTATGLDLRAWWELMTTATPVSQSVQFTFNRKKMLLEMEFRSTAPADDAHGATHYSGPMVLKTQENNGAIYEHHISVHVQSAPYRLDIPVHCRIRKPHRRRRKQPAHADGDEHAPLGGEDEHAAPVEDEPLSMAFLAPPIKWMRVDAGWQWPFASFAMQSLTDMHCCALLLKDGGGDLRSQLQGLQCLEPLLGAGSEESEHALNVLERLILDERSFWAARCEAVRVMSCADANRTLAVLARKFGTPIGPPADNPAEQQYSLPLRPNTFSSPADFRLQRAFARCLPLSISGDGSSIKSACLVVQVVTDFLRFNDNALVDAVVSDAAWLADVLRGLADAIDALLDKIRGIAAAPEKDASMRPPEDSEDDEFEALGRRQRPGRSLPASPSPPAARIEWPSVMRCLRIAVEQVERYVTREHMLPTHGNVLMQAIIRGPWSVLLKHAGGGLEPFDAGLRELLAAARGAIPSLLLRYASPRNCWQVRLACWQVLLERRLQPVSVEQLLELELHMLRPILDTICMHGERLPRADAARLFDALSWDPQCALLLVQCARKWYEAAADDETLAPIKIALPQPAAGGAEQEAIPRVKISLAASAPLKIQLKAPAEIEERSAAPPAGSPLKVKLRLNVLPPPPSS